MRADQPRLSDLLRAVSEVSPLHLAAEWDRVGLLIGDAGDPMERVVLTIDLTEAVLDEVSRHRRRGTAVVAYHPPIFQPLVRVTADDPRGRVALRAARELAGVISPHTALDAMAGGVCDWIAEGVGAGALAPIEPAQALPPGEAMLVVTKLPRTAVDRVRDAMSLAGAGRISAYARCSFETAGHGTFEGDATTNPRVGRRGRFERVEESKLEMVCSQAALPEVLAALRAAHPYEEPPIELLPMAPRPSIREGHGRVLELLRPARADEIAARLRAHLRLAPGSIEVIDAGPRFRESGPRRALPIPRRGRRAATGAIRHRRIGICPGSGGSLIQQAVGMGCTLFVTGELKHHERLEAQARGCSLLLAGHTETERGFLPRYRTLLARRLPGVPVEISRADQPPARSRA